MVCTKGGVMVCTLQAGATCAGGVMNIDCPEGKWSVEMKMVSEDENGLQGKGKCSNRTRLGV